MKYFLSLILCSIAIAAQNVQNPILFVSVVPTPFDSLTQTAAFGSHLGGTAHAPRGGDLYIRYPDGTLKCLTAAAGFGMSGLQSANAIAVREPSMHWSGTKALFSMVVGAPSSKNDTSRFVWQIYEISGLQKQQTPVISKVSNQPASYNNVSPIYGTDDRILFTSDLPRAKLSHLYPRLDEYKTAPTNTGLWSLDAQSGDLFQLDDAVSGDFSPFLDSYGRVLFIRWDHMQRDHQADVDIMQNGTNGSFNYSDESVKGVPLYLQRSEYFPEPQGLRTDLLSGTNMNGFEFNIFLPWQVNEDGSSVEVLNHLGRHDFRQVFGASIKDDPQVVTFNMTTLPRYNQSPLSNIMQIKEDPLVRGSYYAVDANQNGTHGGGQLIKFGAAPGLDPNQTGVSYLTHRATSFYTFEGNTPNTNHSGFYRNPLPTTDGKLIASHSVNTFADKNIGSTSAPLSRYDFRLKFMTQSGSYMVPGALLNSTISKSVSYWTTDTLVSYSGPLWEVDAVEVCARTRPTRRTYSIASPEATVFQEEGVDTTRFREWLRSNNLALISSRDVTVRDKFDKQQPFNLRVAGTQHAHNNGGSGKVYDIAFLQLLQSDHIRGYGMTTATSTPLAGRRVIAQPLRDVTNTRDSTSPIGSVRIQSDGSYAAFVPARRAMTWQMLAPDGTPIVRERYWVTFKAGEVRSCAMCHGTNSESTAPQDSVPQNKPEGLRGLLHQWRQEHLPTQVMLQSPANGSSHLSFPITLQWKSTAKAISYLLKIHTTINGKDSVVQRSVDALTTSIGLTSRDLPTGSRDFKWTVQAIGDWGDALVSAEWIFSLDQAPPPTLTLLSPPDGSVKVSKNVVLRWNPLQAAALYDLEVSTDNSFATTVFSSSYTASQSTALNLKDSTVYYWRVRATLSGPPTPWSTVWSFTTAPKASVLAAVTLISPPDSSTNVDIPTPVSWSTSVGATLYTVQIGTKPDLSDAQGGDCSQSPVQFSALQFATTYYWRVQAKNSSESSAWSQTWSFRTRNQSTAIEADEQSAGLLIAPQPADQSLLVEWNGELNEPTLLRVFDLSGRLVSEFRVDAHPGTNRLRLDCSQMANGTYVLERMDGGQSRKTLYTVHHN